MTAPDPHSPVPPPRPPSGPAYPPPGPPVAYPPLHASPPTSPPLSAPPDPMSGPPGLYSGPPGPYSVSPAAPTPAARRSRGPLLAIGVSTLALLVAVVSLVVAWRAVDQAGDAKRFALAGGGGEAPATQAPAPPPAATSEAAAPPSEAPATDAPADPTPNGTGAPPLNARTVYKPKYENQTLTLNIGCNSSMYIDLDEPRAGVGSTGYDLMFTDPCGADAPRFELGDGADGAAQADTPALTPQDCADRIRTGPLGDRAEVPARKGVVMCVVTSLTKAESTGDEWRMALLEVTGAGLDGVVTVQVRAWDIPR